MELNFGLLLLLSWVCPVFCILNSTSSGLLTLNLDTSSQEHPALGLTLPNLNATDADIAASSSVLPAQHSTNLTTTLKFGPDTVNIKPAANLKIVPTPYRDGVEICIGCALVATLKAILDLTLQDWNEAIPKSKVYRRPKDHPDHTPSVILGVIVIPNQSFRRSQAIYGLWKALFWMFLKNWRATRFEVRMDSITVGYLYYIKDGDHPENAEGPVTNTTFAETTYQPPLLPFNQANDDNLSNNSLHTTDEQRVTIQHNILTGGRTLEYPAVLFSIIATLTEAAQRPKTEVVIIPPSGLQFRASGSSDGIYFDPLGQPRRFAPFFEIKWMIIALERVARFLYDKEMAHQLKETIIFVAVDGIDVAKFRVAEYPFQPPEVAGRNISVF